MVRVMGHLYDQDLVLWSAEQAQALRDAARRGWNAPIDWANVAEEIESLGRSERHAVRSFIALIIEHLMKLQVSPAVFPVRGWEETVVRARRDLEWRLNDSPSLRPAVAAMILDEIPSARELVAAALARHQEQPRVDLALLTYTEDQILGPWLPDLPAATLAPPANRG